MPFLDGSVHLAHEGMEMVALLLPVPDVLEEEVHEHGLAGADTPVEPYAPG